MIRVVSLTVILAAAIILLIIAPDVFLVVFSGILLAVLLHGSGYWIATRLGLGQGWGIALFLLASFVGFAAFGLALAPSIAEQLEELSQKLPAAFQQLRDRVQAFPWGPQLLNRLTPDPSVAGAAAVSAVSSTFGAAGNLVVIIFIGLYGAIDPSVYRRGFKTLLAPSIRTRGEEVMSKVGAVLQNWLVAQFISMSVVGILTAAGLWVAGIPLAFALGLIAGLLAFIPNIGPVIAIAPALLITIPDGLTPVLIVLGIYLSVQAIESYLVTPLVQQEKVSLPPALVIAAQLLFGVLFGILGLALATPVVAVVKTLVQEVYVKDYLERERTTVQANDPA